MFRTHTPSILIPLFIHPSRSAWAPLISRIATHSTLSFLPIVNPFSGPDISRLDPAYATAIFTIHWFAVHRSKSTTSTSSAVSFIAALLRTLYPTPLSGGLLRTLAYIPINYSRRTDILSDIDPYAAWPAPIRPQGIFFDQATWGSTPFQPRATTVLATAILHARNKKFSGPIVLNCGAVPNDPTLFALADQIVAFEGPYSQWIGAGGGCARVAAMATRYGAKKLAVIVHSVPGERMTFGATGLESVVDTVKGAGYASVYATDNLGSYSRYGGDWHRFVVLMDGGSSRT